MSAGVALCNWRNSQFAICIHGNVPLVAQVIAVHAEGSSGSQDLGSTKFVMMGIRTECHLLHFLGNELYSIRLTITIAGAIAAQKIRNYFQRILFAAAN
jgi:hypothetical protein